jgi:transposase
MSKRGNARVRRMLYMSALAAARKEPFAEMKQRIEERSGKAMIALGAVMRKLLIVSWAVYRSDSTWQPRLASPRDEVSRAA